MQKKLNTDCTDNASLAVKLKSNSPKAFEKLQERWETARDELAAAAAAVVVAIDTMIAGEVAVEATTSIDVAVEVVAEAVVVLVAVGIRHVAAMRPTSVAIVIALVRRDHIRAIVARLVRHRRATAHIRPHTDHVRQHTDHFRESETAPREGRQEWVVALRLNNQHDIYNFV